MPAKKCVLYERNCIECGECDKCDLDETKICDNCGKCIQTDVEYKTIVIDEILDSDDE